VVKTFILHCVSVVHIPKFYQKLSDHCRIYKIQNLAIKFFLLPLDILFLNLDFLARI